MVYQDLFDQCNSRQTKEKQNAYSAKQSVGALSVGGKYHHSQRQLVNNSYKNSDNLLSNRFQSSQKLNMIELSSLEK